MSGLVQPRHQVQVDAGVTDNGVGLRIGGSWRAATTSRAGVAEGTGALGAGDLRFLSLATVDLRLFADLRLRTRWARGTRVTLAAVNLLNDRQRVRDAAGTTPLAYRAAYLDPLGRTVRLTVRRLL